jgi:hypothetical protein
MGTLNFTVGRYAPSRGQSPGIPASTVVTSDSYTTSTSASFVEDGSGDITVSPGVIFMCTADEPMWIRFGGDAATVGDGHYILAGARYEFEVVDGGKVSAIDVS